MTIGSWLKIAKGQIDTLDAELILLFVLCKSTVQEVDRSYIFAHPEVEIAPKWQAVLDKMLEKRATGVPLAYVLGEKEFYGRKFEVNPDVLIPRPETEALIDLVRTLPLPKQPSFLEIGTGSGCIAITLALEYPQSYVLATDVSVKALDVACRNDIVYEGRVEFLQSNLLRDVSADEGHFDVLVANLPYVDPSWEWLDQSSLCHEPSRALYVKQEGGLALYQRLFRELKLRQGRGGFGVDYVVVEADPCQHTALVRMAERHGLLCLRTKGFGLVFERRRRHQAQQKLQSYLQGEDENRKLVDVEARLAEADYQDHNHQDTK